MLKLLGFQAFVVQTWRRRSSPIDVEMSCRTQLWVQSSGSSPGDSMTHYLAVGLSLGQGVDLAFSSGVHHFGETGTPRLTFAAAHYSADWLLSPAPGGLCLVVTVSDFCSQPLLCASLHFPVVRQREWAKW